MAVEAILLLLLGVAKADISNQHPPAGSCLCLSTSNVNVRNAACGSIIGSAASPNCFISHGNKIGCSLSGTYYEWFDMDYNGQPGWIAGNFLTVGTSGQCGVISPAPDVEFRSLFLTTAWNIDWPRSSTSSPATQQAELLEYLNIMDKTNMNAVHLQVRPSADAVYASGIEPWSRFLTGSQGTPPNPMWDPLAYCITEAHARGIEVHAWLNPYRANTAGNFNGLAPNNIANVHRQYAYIYGSSVYMDPGASVVEDWLVNVIEDIVSRYDVDGIHFDDYFYPYPIAGVDFPDDATYNAYIQGGGSMSLADWRRDNVNGMVSRVYAAIKAIKPGVVFSISPFGIYRPGHPEGQPPSIIGTDGYSALYADAKLWLEQGWVDLMEPQIYWAIDPPAQSYPVILDWWLDNNPMGRHVYGANGAYKIDDANNWPVSELTRQVDISRDEARRAKYSLGNTFFSAKYWRDNTKSIDDIFQSSVYTNHASIPPMDWMNLASPEAPYDVTLLQANTISWKAAKAGGEVFRWMVYKLKGGQWRLKQILPAGVSSVTVEAGTYGVRAMNPARVLSDQVIIQV